jgi:predicted phosphodiesterase
MLDALPMPWLAIPGNHDVPLHNLFARVFSPLGGFHRYITHETAPRFAGAGLRVLGLDSTRRKVVGRLKPERLEPIPWLAGGDPGDLRVLVTHHPLVRKPLEGAPRAIAAAAAAGVEVVCAGHHHNAHILPVPGTDMLAIEAPSPSHILEPVKGFFVISATLIEITVQLWTFDGVAFSPTGQPHVKPRNATLTRL